MVILSLIAIVFYANTLTNQYALDDGLVITDNPYTQQGIDGIDDILTRDTYQWYYDEKGSAGELSGGRYRPLSIVTFAIEYAIAGESPAMSHGINMLLYLLSGLVLFVLLRKFWTPRQPRLSFLVPLLFLIHPVHTEAVANIKGRDELMAFLLLFTTLWLVFRYLRSGKAGHVIAAVAVFFLALMTKENSITFLAVIPLACYFFSKTAFQHILKLILPFAGAAVVYLFIRYKVVGLGGGSMDDVMNDPFLYASWAEQKATAFFILLKYLQLQFWPHPLSYDYGFQQIAYKAFSDPWVILSIVLHVGILIAGLAGLIKKRIWAFAALYYLVTLSIVSNLLIPLGGTMGERLIYLSSFGFVLALGWMLMRIYKAIPTNVRQPVAALFLTIILVASGYKTISRNADWKSNQTLFVEDANKVPNSIKANTAAANALIDLYLEEQDPAYLRRALPYYKKADSLYPVKEDSTERSLYMYNNYINQSYIYFTLDSLEQSEMYWTKARNIKPGHPKIAEYARVLGELYLRRASEVATNDVQQALPLYEKAAKLDRNNARAWYNLGGASYTVGNYERAEEAFARAVEINPDHQQAQQGLSAVKDVLRNSR